MEERPVPQVLLGWEVVPQAMSMGTEERTPVPQAVVLLEGCAVRAEKAVVCAEEVAAMG